MEDNTLIKLADGTLIDPDSKRPIVSTDINKAFSDKPELSITNAAKKRELAPFEGAQRRYLDDLPGNPNQIKAASVICSLHVFGWTAGDIAYIVGTDTKTVEAIIQSQLFQKLLGGMLQQLREHDTNKIRKKLNQAAEGAVDKITSLSESQDEKVALAASKDILDRVERDYGSQDQSNQVKSALTIRIIDDRDNPADKVKVDIEDA